MKYEQKTVVYLRKNVFFRLIFNLLCCFGLSNWVSCSEFRIRSANCFENIAEKLFT